MKRYIVCGPPGSGKTSYVREHKSDGDIIVDMDAIYAAITGDEWYAKPVTLLPLVLSIKDFIIAQLKSNKLNVYHAWVISGLPGREERSRLAYQLEAYKVIVLETPPNECLRRIGADPRRAKHVNLWSPLVFKWWEKYEANPNDTVIKPTAGS